MKWTRGRRSSLLIDRRGERPASPGRPRRVGRISVGAVVVLLLAYGAIRLLGGDSGPRSRTTSAPASSELTDFLSFLIEDTNAVWRKKLEGRAGVTFEPAPMVVFEGTTRTACGPRRARSGPAYCPADKRMYVPPSFYRELRDRLGAPGDFAQAIVVAHEMGHHVQRLLGVTRSVRDRSLKDSSAKQELQIRQELQADCFAGVWAHSTAERKMLERGDVEEALRAAEAIGDDALQKQAGREVDSTKWSHGSSEQRVRWFQTGLRSGSVDDCDTFAAASP